MGARRQARILAFQTLFRYDLSQATVDNLLDFSWYNEDRGPALSDDVTAFAQILITGAIENIAEIDRAIREHLLHWDFDRLSRVDCAILRMSVYCLLFRKDIPYSVTIDEAIHIAKEYGSDESYKFVNGVLDAIVKNRLPAEAHE